MSTSSGTPSDLRSPVTESDILESARSLRATADAAEALLLVKACEWADFHPVLNDGDEAFEDENLPGVHYDCTATFALNIGLSDAAGTNLIHEALELRHRLPRTWARVKAGEVTAWRARRIAQRTIHQPADVARLLDTTVARIAHKVGVITLDRLIEEAKMRLHPIETEQAEIDRLERREVWLDHNMSHEGIAHMEIRADFIDLFAFDKTVSDIARVLGELGNTDDLDGRRSLAIGVLADPQQAADLLSGDADALKKPAKCKRVQLVVHTTPGSFTGDNPVGRLEQTGQMPILEEAIRAWCGRTDADITVLPIVDLAENITVTQYEVPDRIKVQVEHRDITCVFPHCTRPALRSDNDHIQPHPDGPTSTLNIAALCRRHHRVKTHGGWTYQRVGPRAYFWTNEHGYQYFRDHEGTVEVERATTTRLPRAG